MSQRPLLSVAVESPDLDSFRRSRHVPYLSNDPRACLKLVPHEAFTFAKIWLMAAHFEVSGCGGVCALGVMV